MSKLDADIRGYIERVIDTALTEENTELDTQQALIQMGIEPNLETKLSYITGQIYGIAFGLWIAKWAIDKKTAEISVKEREDFDEAIMRLLDRRAEELRQHFIKSKYL